MYEFDFDSTHYIKKKFPFACFKGGSGGAKAPAWPSLSSYGAYSEEQMAEAIQNVLEGRSWGGLTEAALPRRLEALKSGYNLAQTDLSGMLNRFVPKADIGVREYAGKNLYGGYLSGIQDIKEETKQQPYLDKETAMELGTEWLAQAKRMGVSLAEAYNKQQYSNLLNMYGGDTFSSNLASGLGGMGGWMLASEKFGQGFV